MPVRSPLLALALVLAACGPADRGSSDSARETSAAASGAVRGTDNLVPPIIAAVEAMATVGEISDAMRAVFGEHREIDA